MEFFFRFMKMIRCWIKAVPRFVKKGYFVPHLYECEYEKAIIIADDNGFRVATGYEHSPGEIVYKDACYIKCTCKRCGHKTYGWYRSWEDRWKIKE